MQAGFRAEETIDCSEEGGLLALIRPASSTPSTLACTVDARASLLWMMLLPRACSSGGSVHTAAVACPGCSLDLSAGQTMIAGGCASCHTTSGLVWSDLPSELASPLSVARRSRCLIDVTQPRYEVETPSSAPNTRHILRATGTPT